MTETLELGSITNYDEHATAQLLGVGKEGVIHEEVTAIKLRYPSPGTFSLFLRHAPEVFPNLVSLEIDSPSIMDDFVSTHVDQKDCTRWPRLESLTITAMRKDLVFLLEWYEYPALRSLKYTYPTADIVRAIAETQHSWPELEAVDIKTYRVQSYRVFEMFRSAGMFSRLDTIALHIREVGTVLEAACLTAELTLDETIPFAWRAHLFDAIRTPTNKKVLYKILKHIGADVTSKMSRPELDAIYKESFPSEFFAYNKTPPFDLTQCEDF